MTVISGRGNDGGRAEFHCRTGLTTLRQCYDGTASRIESPSVSNRGYKSRFLVAFLRGTMRLRYIDESRTPDIPGNTFHFVLAGLSVPEQYWQEHYRQVGAVKGKYALAAAEVHVAWMLRPYVEQQNIPYFDAMGYAERRAQMQRARATEILRLRRSNARHYKQPRKNCRQTNGYVRLTLTERRQAALELAGLIANWGIVRLYRRVH